MGNIAVAGIDDQFANGACGLFAKALHQRIDGSTIVLAWDGHIVIHAYIRLFEGGVVDATGYWPDEAAFQANLDDMFLTDPKDYRASSPQEIDYLIENSRLGTCSVDLMGELDVAADTVVSLIAVGGC